jgi:carboxylesterase
MFNPQKRFYPVIWGAEPWSFAGEGELAQTTIVVIHGFTGNPISTKPLGKALAQRGFGVEVVRLPGHGTHWLDMMQTRYSDWRGEVERVLDAQLAKGKRVVLAGLSMGGTIAIDLASLRPDDVAGAVTINGSFLDRDGLLVKYAWLLEKFIPVAPAAAAGLVKNDAAKPGVDEKSYLMVPAAAGNSLLKVLPRLRERLSLLKCPVMVAYSPQDHSVSCKNSEALLEFLRGKLVSPLRLERSYHLATLDFDADLLQEKIAEFAQRLLPRRFEA